MVRQRFLCPRDSFMQRNRLISKERFTTISGRSRGYDIKYLTEVAPELRSLNVDCVPAAQRNGGAAVHHQAQMLVRRQSIAQRAAEIIFAVKFAALRFHFVGFTRLQRTCNTHFRTALLFPTDFDITSNTERSLDIGTHRCESIGLWFNAS